MTARTTPILLRRGGLSGNVMALHRYTHKTVRGRQVIDAGMNGKQDVTADFDNLMLEELMDPDALDIVGILDGVVHLYALTAEEIHQVKMFRERLRAACERVNARNAIARPES